MAGITGFKVALCLSYLRILNKSNKTYRKFVWVVLITCVLSHLGGTLVLIFQCKPVHIKSPIPVILSNFPSRLKNHGFPKRPAPASPTTPPSTL